MSRKPQPPILLSPGSRVRVTLVGLVGQVNETFDYATIRFEGGDHFTCLTARELAEAKVEDLGQ